MTGLQRAIKYCAIAFAVFLIVSIIGGIVGTLGTVAGLFGGNAVGDMKTYEIEGNIESIEAEIGAASLEIVSGDSFSVESNHKYLTVKEEKNTLKITEKRTVIGVSSGNVKVVVTVPEDFVFENAEISAGAGKVKIDSLLAKDLNLELGAGETDIEKLSVKNSTKISSGTGKLTIRDGELCDLNMEIGVGKLEFCGKLNGDCKVDYGIGGADFILSGKKDDYRIALDKGLGEAVIDGEKMSDGDVVGDGDCRIEIDGGIGSLNIDFEKSEK